MKEASQAPDQMIQTCVTSAATGSDDRPCQMQRVRSQGLRCVAQAASAVTNASLNTSLPAQCRVALQSVGRLEVDSHSHSIMNIKYRYTLCPIKKWTPKQTTII